MITVFNNKSNKLKNNNKSKIKTAGTIIKMCTTNLINVLLKCSFLIWRLNHTDRP